MSKIQWGEKYPPRKRDKGHSAIQYGYGENTGYGAARIRTYVRCQCGVRLSGQGDDGAISSYQRHLARQSRRDTDQN